MDTISVSAEDTKIIEKQVESGRFESAGEVISASLRLLEDVGSFSDAWMRKEIPTRLADYDRDPSIAVPLAEAFGQIDEMYRRDLEAVRGK